MCDWHDRELLVGQGQVAALDSSDQTCFQVAFEESSKNVGLALAGLAGVVIGIVLLAYFVEDAEENAIEAKPAANAFNPATSGSGPPPELSHGGSEETVTLLPTQETAGGGTRTYWILGAVLAG